MIIAIDGPAASGKGTLAKRLAAHFALPHLDTGLLYRAVGVAAFRQGADLTKGEAIAEIAEDLDITGLDHPILRGSEAGELASKVGSLPEVRAALLNIQREFANQTGGAVLDGRDIGTIIAPHADVKFFVTASAEVRAERRHKELASIPYETILADIKRRDERDSARSQAPLKAAEDAVLLETSNMTADEVFEKALKLIDANKAVR
jgi:CMP/dCMP kinase